jgi:hypothetical protein
VLKMSIFIQKKCKEIVGDSMVQKAVKLTRYINTETGEYFDKGQYVDLQFNEDGYLFWNRKGNVKTFLDCRLPKEFTWTERGRIEELKHYILKDNQFLVYRSGNTIKPLGIKEMMRILGMTERQCRALIRKLKTFNIIKEVRVETLTYFVFNPIYGFKGKRLSLNVYLFFQEELKQILPKWVVEKFVGEAEEIKPEFKIIK